MSRQALLSPRSSIVDETDKFICPVCEFANPVVLRDDIEFDDSDDEDVPKYEDTVCQLCRFFDMLLMLSGRVTSTKDFQRLAARREAGGEFIRAADVVLAYKLYQFHTMVPSNNYAAEIDSERQTSNRFKQLFAKVVLLAHDKYRRVTGRSGLWTIGTARRKFTRATLAKLWTTMTSPELRRETQHAAESVIVGTVAHVFDSIPGFGVTSPTSGDETLSSYRALTQLGALECVQLADMFFGRPIKRLINEINQKVMYFDTLFMHIEVNTFGGNVDGQIDDEEFFEGLNLLGIPPETMDVPMVHFRAFVKEYGVQELTKPLFRILVLQLSSPSAATNDENIVDMVGGAIKPRSKASNARRLQVLAQTNGQASVAESVASDGLESKAQTELSDHSGGTSSYAASMSQRGAFGEKPHKKREKSWRITNDRLADVRSSVLSMHFVVEFRKRLQFLFCSAEGNVRAINWRTFWLSLLTNAFMPIAMAQMLYRRSVDMGFDLYYLVYYAIGLAYWVAIMWPVCVYVIDGIECITLFEVFYPLVTFFLACMAVAVYRGYYDIALHPSTFKFLRLKYRLESLSVVFHFFETGDRKVEPVLEVLRREGIMPNLHKRQDLLSSQASLMDAFSTNQKKAIYALSGLCAVVVALLPGALRSLPDDVFQTHNCRQFFAGDSEHATDLTIGSVCYVITALTHTFLFSLFLVRLYIKYAHIARYFAKFTALMDPMDARKKRVDSLISFANEEGEGLQSGGRLSGYTDMRIPRNVAAWSKIRVFMLQKFADDLGQSELFLAFFVLFGLLVAIVSVTFVVLPRSTLDKIDGNTGGYDAWQWKLMALLCGIAAAIVMVPVFLVLSYGVRVNSHLSSHHGKLLRLKYSLSELAAQAKHRHALGLHNAEEVSKLETSRHLVGDLINILSYQDTQIKILGIAITSTLIRTVFSSIAVAAASSMAKVLSTVVKKPAA